MVKTVIKKIQNQTLVFMKTNGERREKRRVQYSWHFITLVHTDSALLGDNIRVNMNIV